jgi:hypothetical protein
MQDIPFMWAGTDPEIGLDCFGLASHVSDRLFGTPFDLSICCIARSYQDYPTAESAPRGLLRSLAEEIGLDRVSTTQKGTLLLINSTVGFCLATCLGDGQVVYMGPVRSKVRAIADFNGGDIVAAYSPDKLLLCDRIDIQESANRSRSKSSQSCSIE